MKRSRTLSQQTLSRAALAVLTALGVVLAIPALAGPAQEEDGTAPRGMTAARFEAGRRVYRSNCQPCHGAKGDGLGPFAAALVPKPRNFVLGDFKWRSTPSGSLPLDSDLERTIRNGLPGSAMAAWQGILTDDQILQVIEIVKSFSPRYADEEPEPPTEVPEGLPGDPTGPDSKGAETYVRLECGKCHGDGGRGDGPSSKGQVDSLGNPIPVFDLTRGYFRCGETAGDVYKAFTNGLTGTPMPSFEQTTTPEERWELARYVIGLKDQRSWWTKAWDFLFGDPTWAW